MLIDRTNHALRWYKYGLEHDEDFISKFMMHWIAFNWLYSTCGNKSERQNIKDYCKRADTKRKLALYDPFETDEIEVFKQGPVLRMGGPESGDDPEDLWESICHGRNNSTQRATDLLLTIYQVRCNLFHGSKSPDDSRDLALVEASAEIMYEYLKRLLSDNYYFNR